MPDETAPITQTPMSKWRDHSLFLPASMARWLLVFLFIAGVYFFHGFIVPALTALVISVATWPLYKKLLKALNYHKSLSATIALLVAIVFLVVPLGILTSYAIKEITIWLAWAVEANAKGAAVPVWIASLPVAGDWLAQQWDLYIGHPGMIGTFVQQISGSNVGSIYSGVLTASGSLLHILLTLIFILITLFFIYRDGLSFVDQLDRIGEYVFPGRWTRISRIVPMAINSTVVGMGIIAIGEGIVLGTAYWIAGVPSPVMLGVLTGIMAMVPGGAPLCFTLVSTYLVASGAPLEGMLLFAWGASELFFVDKFLRPHLVGGPIRLPFLPTFFGLIGGVKTMGFVGLFIGPALMALIISIWREAIDELSGKNDVREGSSTHS